MDKYITWESPSILAAKLTLKFIENRKHGQVHHMGLAHYFDCEVDTKVYRRIENMGICISH